eukprot:m.199426 g.199426  ORF g.199426 m.199426 type:complete len:87 (+) comp25170_c2_seq2:221-481(+)
MELRVLLFAEAREVTGVSETKLAIGIEAMTAATLMATLITKFPSLKPISGTVVLALNEEYIDMAGPDPVSIKDGDTLAIIPPLSGG